MLRTRAVFALIAAASLAACSVPGPGQAPDGVWDPYEAQNRRVHAFNRKIDERVLRGTGAGLADSVPDGSRQAVAQFADTVGTPQTVLNQLLQLRLWRATKNTLRFTMNATLGLGILDPAAEIGLVSDESDFGETLAVWGLPEGAYLELPMVGPSTERDAVGSAVDLVTNPLSYALPSPEKYIGTAARVADKVIKRGEFGETVDSVLYDSADSYAQARLIYLQNRRFELGEDAPGAADIDPMALDTTGF
ncbi:MlaA family lipoprotein [Sagittula stellata]|uniref:Putative lipoprotein n=1 Tax=Sagittula stellata (strain ATCC 700073 / DSM 11524 / E-37) TaxID=388399 RepID=A3JYB1_SAGS3|nr:VacJ family lipoprotein [Sagittula stellata]EBA10497.1 putative lipoprotein [Sagittula stellata E-37]